MLWATLGCSVVGTSHRARSVPCQDVSRVCAFGPGSEWLVIAVADGAGSASRSEVGAAAACVEFVRLITTFDHDRLFTKDGMVAVISDVRAALFDAAGRLGVAPREVACTAL